MELEFFCLPEQAEHWFEYYINKSSKFVQDLGLSSENIKIRSHEKEELSHYSAGITDIEFNFPFGWGELLGLQTELISIYYHIQKLLVKI